MSTSHHGDYCPHKDKQMLTREVAHEVAGRMGMISYKCKVCGAFHTAHRMNKMKPRKGRK